MSDLSTQKMPTVQNLQVLRFVAAFMVLFSHVQHELTVRGGEGASAFHAFDPVFWPGGVDIFFIISGFIMYFIGHRAFATPGGARDFMLKRLIRIAPIYWIFTTLMLVSIVVLGSRVAHSELSPLNVVFSYLFIPSRNAYGELLPVLALGWTLNFEMMFYVVFSLGLLLPLRKGVTFVACAISAFAALSIMNLSRFAALDFWTNPIVMEFLFGIGLAAVYLSGFRLEKWISALLVAAAVGLMVLAKAMRADVDYWNWRFVWMGVPAFILCAGLTLVRNQGVAHGVKKILVLGGDASYVLYLSHPFVINVVGLVWSKLKIHGNIAYIAIAMGAAVIGSILIHVYFERALSRWLTRLIFRSSRRPSLSNAPA